MLDKERKVNTLYVLKAKIKKKDVNVAEKILTLRHGIKGLVILETNGWKLLLEKDFHPTLQVCPSRLVFIT